MEPPHSAGLGQKIHPNIIASFLCAALATVSLLSVQHLSITYDEDNHSAFGRKILALDSSRPESVYDSTMPFSAFNMLPQKIGDALRPWAPAGLVSFLGSLTASRGVTLLFSLLLAWYLYSWSRQLYGPPAGIFSLFLYVFSPNFIAHGQLVTTDVFACCMMTIACYYFWKFIHYPNWKTAGISAGILALSQLGKYACIALYPVFALICVCVYAPKCMAMIQSGNTRELVRRAPRALAYVAAYMLISIAILNIGFLFNRSFTPLKNYTFTSALFKKMQATPLRHLPVPVPYPYLQGLDMLQEVDETGSSHANLYLLGRLHTHANNKIEPFPGYFLYAYAFKEPLAIQIFILITVIWYATHRKKFHFLDNELFLLCPVIVYGFYLNFIFKTHIGIRYFLPVVPFLYIWCGSIADLPRRYGAKIRCAFIALLAYLAISSASYYPHYLSYCNELVWDRTGAYKVLADSNIDWGQSEWYLKKYTRRHPGVPVNPEFLAPGKVVVSVNELVGLFNPEKYRWLREHSKPQGQIAYSYLIYDIPPEGLHK